MYSASQCWGSNPLVPEQACAELGVDYADTSGESTFMRCYDENFFAEKVMKRVDGVSHSSSIYLSILTDLSIYQ